MSISPDREAFLQAVRQSSRLRGVMRKAGAAREAGGLVFFKFTCFNCKERLGFETPNTIWPKATCDKCFAVTDLASEEAELGFLLVVATHGPRVSLN